MDTHADAPRAAAVRDLALAAAADRKGIRAIALDVRALTEVTDYMVIVSGSSSRHVRAIVDSVLEAAKENGIAVLGTEGREHCDWVLIDLADAVIHVMRPETRDFYDLERLWEAHDPSQDPARQAGSAQ